MTTGPGESLDAALSGTPASVEASAERAIGAGRLAPEQQGNLRGLAAKGIVINAAFLVGLNLLGFIKGFGVAAFLHPSEYGVWGLLAVSFATLFQLIQVGVDDKYVQQDDSDQERAFQEAFTMQCLLCGAFVVLIGVAMPLYAIAYDDWAILLPGYALALAIPANALQVPLWAYYRNMDFLTQRRLQIFDPVVGFVATMVLAATGFGYWSLVLGVVAGAWAAAIVAMRHSPFPLRWRYRRGTLREYWNFSGPLFYAALIIIVIAQVPVLVGKHAVGLVGVGAMAVANNISQYATRVDDIVTNTLYPAVCAVKDRRDLLLETFLKSNRLALLWAAPVGAGIALFGADIVAHLLGDRWGDATYAIQAIGVAAGINQIGFNWTAFYRALGITRPMAVASAVMCVGVLGAAIPLLIVDGVDGYATGMGIATLLLVACRLYYLGKLFPLRPVFVNCLRGMLPTVPAVGVVLAIRAVRWGGERTTGDFLVELGAFAVTLIAVTLWSERKLLGEFRGYLTGRRPGLRTAAAAAAEPPAA